jgi:hypothetical protein|tara:strand:+ start:832 stop:1290 length:459 start_codon:yes stop_codon:yes gene_type:complete
MNNIPITYIPKHLSEKDRKKQRRNIINTRKLYSKKKYIQRPDLETYKRKKSSHVTKATKMYGVQSIVPSKELSRKTGCTIKALRQIEKKGHGAFYSSGSRPMQTAQSWGRARIASSITGGPASNVDYHILKKGCTNVSRALKLAQQTRKKRV